MLFPASLILLLVFPLLIAHFYEGIEFKSFSDLRTVRAQIKFDIRMETNEIRNKTKFIKRTSNDDIFCLEQGIRANAALTKWWKFPG